MDTTHLQDAAMNIGLTTIHSGANQNLFRTNLANGLAKGASLTRSAAEGQLRANGRTGALTTPASGHTQPHSNLTFEQLFANLANGTGRSVTG
jgi:hypothetical protein